MPKTDPTLSSQQISQLVALAGDAIVLIDEEQHILLFNRCAEALFGFTAEEAVGASFALLFPPETRDLIQQTSLIRQASPSSQDNQPQPAGSAPTPALRLRCRCRNGDELETEASLAAVTIDGRAAVLLILRADPRPGNRGVAAHGRLR